MLNRLRHPDLRPIVAALYAVAMLWLGLAHRAPAVAAAGHPEILRIALPDGSLTAWCLNDLGQEPGQQPGHQPGRGTGPCDACLLIAAIGLPPVPAGLPAPANMAVTRIAAPSVLAGTIGAVDRPRSRGPPSRA
ncbi:hypothetical protein [Phreatobacter stygius]|uniref:DUF2946 domain-containing protein n=1 Tax=Phreatobacter stygius TaxID=1940610 RepID=A0A4D7BAN3_9HYPH|nr:hypothetical protein [Phreatobacter stygius]QCI67198.1 hypothetical protein E8M01_24965 [Phreatobacter stygius]